MCGPWTSHVLELCMRHPKHLQWGPLNPDLDESLRSPIWTEHHEVAVRLAQAQGILADVQEGITVAEHAWHGHLWEQSVLPPSAIRVSRSE